MKTGQTDNFKRLAFLAAFLTVLATLFGCGGGGGSGPGSTPVIVSGVMTKGSVIVNGIRFEDTTANITADDTAKTAAFLDSGMIVKVKGRLNADGVTGTAERIEVENEVRGLVTAKTADTITVLQQTVAVDSRTIFAGGITGLDGLTPSVDEVEVHGQRDASGIIRATRIEKVAGNPDDEIRGTVSNLTTNTSFSIGSLTVTYDGATPIVPAGAVLANGTLVEVHLNGIAATRIEIEDAEDAEFEPAEGQEVDVEGYVTGLNIGLGDFEINGTRVHITGSTEYEGGVAADLVNNTRVEAEGHMASGVLVADKISFKDSVEIQSNVVSSATDTFTVLNKVVKVTSVTEMNGLSMPLADGSGIRIRGFGNGDGSITATRIEGIGTVSTNNHILQGPVSSFNTAAKTLGILGITVNASTVDPAEVKNDNGQIITIDQFFASLIAIRTIVKTRGSFSADTLTAVQIELE